jgi:hypothetical protein
MVFRPLKVLRVWIYVVVKEKVCSRHAFAPAAVRVVYKIGLSRLCDSSKFFHILVLKTAQQIEECMDSVQNQRLSIGVNRVLACC